MTKTVTMRLVRKTLWFGILLMAVCANARAAEPDTGNPHMAERWWHDRFEQKQAELHKRPVRLIFLGDSITHSFEWTSPTPVWDKWYGGRNAVNLGFNSDKTADVIWRVSHGELDGVSPALAVILIGTNDFDKPPAAIAAGIEDLVGVVHDRSPHSKILVLGILPSGRPAAEQGLAREVNGRLSMALSRPGSVAVFDDVSCVFTQHGRVNLHLFREPAVPGGPVPLHPTPEGMDLLAAKIEPVVAAALGDRARTTPDALKDTDCSGRG